MKLGYGYGYDKLISNTSKSEDIYISTWIMFNGTWNDNGFWIDSENWNDN